MSQPSEPGSDNEEPVTRSKSVWNSLEIARLIMSAAIPIAILLLGVVLSTRAAERADNREAALRKAAEQREDQLRQFATRREDSRRIAAERREEQLRAAATTREDRLAASTAAREDATRRDSIAREEILRRQATDTARYDRLVARRMELWDRFAPKLRNIRLTIVSISNGCQPTLPCSREAALADLIQISGDMQIYHPYFSSGFHNEFGVVELMAWRLLESNRPISPADGNAFSREYYQLIRSVVEEFTLVVDRPDRRRSGR